MRIRLLILDLAAGDVRPPSLAATDIEHSVGSDEAVIPSLAAVAAAAAVHWLL